MPLALLLATLALPIAAVLAMRARALAPKADPARAWFDFARGSSLAVTVGWLGWLAAGWTVGPSPLALAQLWPLPRWLFGGAFALGIATPPSLMALAVVALSHPVSVRLRGDGWRRREVVAQAAWRLAGLLLPLAAFVCAVNATLQGRWRAAAACALAALVLRVLCTRRQLGALDLAPRAITSGPLRDRVFALAAAAGVRLRMLYLVTTARGRVANAFAVRGNVVLLTDYLLQNLSRREVDAVLAHELAHLKRGHPRKLAIPPAVLIALVLVFGGGVDPRLLLPAAVLAASLAMLLVARRFEYQADLGAVQLTRDPEALISALAKLSRLNHVPLDWSDWGGVLLTHPSVRRRARALARAAGLDEARIETVLREGCGDETRHELPPAAADKLFSTRYKASSASRIGAITLATLALAPVALLAAAARLPFDLPRAALVGLGALAAFALALLAHDLLAARPYGRLRRGLAARLEAEGLPVEGATFVGLSPGDRARVYEGFSDWDVGWLFVRGDRLCYVGEETRWALSRDQVIDVRLGARVPGWITAPRVIVDWRGGSLSLRPAAITRVSAGSPAAWRLLGVLGAWHDALSEASPAPPSPALDALGPPPDGEVTAVHPKQITRPATLVPVAMSLALVGVLACALFGLSLDPWQGAGFADAWLAGFAAAVALRLPWWTWRERRGSPVRARDEQQRRAA